MLDNDAVLPPEKSELEVIKDSTSTLYLAGSDTTVGAVIAFFLAMLVYPDVQRKAQAEIDRVVGKDRLPEINDAPQLPYVQGVVNECLRWLPVTPLGGYSLLDRREKITDCHPDQLCPTLPLAMMYIMACSSPRVPPLLEMPG
jgi:cytochrome P450